MIKWCLYLKLRSYSTYDALRLSGCLTLPTERTLRDYTHHFKDTVGFNAKLDEQLFRESDVANLEDWQKYIVLMFDEMKVKEDLVYDMRTGELIGFVNFGDINDHLQHFEQTLSSDISNQCIIHACVYGKRNFYQVGIFLCPLPLLKLDS